MTREVHTLCRVQAATPLILAVAGGANSVAYMLPGFAGSSLRPRLTERSQSKMAQRVQTTSNCLVIKVLKLPSCLRVEVMLFLNTSSRLLVKYFTGVWAFIFSNKVISEN